MNNTGANLTGTPLFGIGLCAGTSNILLDATTTHFVGMISNGATWTYAAAAAGNMTRYGMGNSTLTPGKRVGSTISVFSGFATAPFFTADATTATRRMMFVDLTKGSPNFTFAALFCSGTAASPDVLDTDFLAQVVLSTPSFTNHTYSGGSTLAVSETDGTLTHVNVAWNRSTPTFEICDLAVVQLA